MSEQRKAASHYGWIIVGAGVLSMAVQSSIWISGSLFLVPITLDTGWPRAAVSAAISQQILGRGLWAPVVGSLIGVWGLRRVMPLAAIVLAGGLLALSGVQSVLAFSLLMFSLVSPGAVGIGDLANYTAVQSWFSNHRGMALGLVDAGSALGFALLGPLIQQLILALGWRGGYQALAAMALLLAPLHLLLQRQPPLEVQPSVPVDPVLMRQGLGVTTLLRQRTFWLILFSLMTASSGLYLVSLHQIAYLTDHGFDSAAISAVLVSLGLVGIVGRVASGWLSDTIGTTWAFALVTACVVLGIGCLVIAGQTGLMLPLYLFAVFFGSSLGAHTLLLARKAADLFGSRIFSTAVGLMALAGGLGGALGTAAAGVVFDATGTYLSSFGAASIVVLVACLCMWAIAPGGRPGAHAGP